LSHKPNNNRVLNAIQSSEEKNVQSELVGMREIDIPELAYSPSV